MNINDILTPQVVSLIITAVIVPTIFKIIDIAVKNIEARTKNENANKYIELAEGAVETAVTAVSQIYVDGLKKSGSFDQAAKEEAFNQARTRALSIMGDAAKEALKEVYGDLNAWLDNKVEYYVDVGKKSA